MSDENRGEFIGDPWWLNHEQALDYTKRRTGAITWTMDDVIGRKDVQKWTLTTNNPTDITSVSGSIMIS